MNPTYPDLQGRGALVTGASSGIGMGIAEALLGQGMGVAVHYRNRATEAARLCEAHRGRVSVASNNGATFTIHLPAMDERKSDNNQPPL